jgi:hypothetical protein
LQISISEEHNAYPEVSWELLRRGHRGIQKPKQGKARQEKRKQHNTKDQTRPDQISRQDKTKQDKIRIRHGNRTNRL